METYLDSGGRLLCPPELVPAPGQYLLAHASASDSPLAVPVFFSESAPGGFRTAPSLPAAWFPGTSLHLRGPLGHGFSLPISARRVALVAFDDSPARLRGLIQPALRRGAAITLVCKDVSDDLPEDVEVQPLRALSDVLNWADYAAFDVARETLPELRSRLGRESQVQVRWEAQVLIRAPMPCGALADCGVCAVTVKHGWKMVCKDGPVFDLAGLI